MTEGVYPRTYPAPNRKQTRCMTKLQFLLVSAIATSALFLLVGSRDGNAFGSLLPVAVVVALASLVNRYLPEALWERAAIWVNQTSGRRIFRTRMRRLPPSRSRRL